MPVNGRHDARQRHHFSEVTHVPLKRTLSIAYEAWLLAADIGWMLATTTLCRLTSHTPGDPYTYANGWTTTQCTRCATTTWTERPR